MKGKFNPTEIDKMTKYLVNCVPGYKNYHLLGLTKQDLITAGQLGYLQAQTYHKPENGAMTSGYVFKYINAELSKLFKDAKKHSNVVSIEDYQKVEYIGLTVSPEFLYEQEEATHLLYKYLDELDDRTKRIIIDLHLSTDSKTVGFLAQDLFLSEQRVNQIAQNGLKKLQQLMANDGME